MSATLSPAMSVVLNKKAITSDGFALANIVGDAELPVFDEDQGVCVIGPLYENHTLAETLSAMGLREYDHFFSIPHSGGEVPEWCELHVSLRVSTP